MTINYNKQSDMLCDGMSFISTATVSRQKSFNTSSKIIKTCFEQYCIYIECDFSSLHSNIFFNKEGTFTAI